ncbi:MAG: CBS domain-containing protein [Cyanobacteria bacterium J06641_5]
MQFERSMPHGIDTEQAIDRNPLTGAPDLRVAEAIALMSATRGSLCGLQDEQPLLEGSVPEARARSSCLLVVSEGRCQGIFTERDIVKLSARQACFEEICVGQVMSQPVITLTLAAFQDVFAALFLFRRYRIRHLPIVDDDGRTIGVVSSESIRRILRPSDLLKRRRVADVMAAEVVYASPATPVLELAQLMANHRVSCVAIVEVEATMEAAARLLETHEGINCNAEELPRLQPVGIVTERDIVQFQSLQLDLAKTQAGTIMSAPLFLLSPDDSLWHAHQEMEKRRVRRLLVSWNWGLGLGIVTRTSLLRVFDPMEMYGVIEALQQTVRELQAKVTGADEADTTSDRPPLALLPETPAVHLAPNTTTPSPQTHVQDPESTRLLSQVQSIIQELLDSPDLSTPMRQTKLRQVDRELATLRSYLQVLNKIQTTD